jgi:starch-binding outer membrane protein, SusD/RagB family
MKYSKIIITIIALAIGFSSCLKDLNRKPITDITAEDLYKNFSNYRNVLAKCYAGLATTGNTGTGKNDLEEIDGGASAYLRILWCMQDLTTDVGKCAWKDNDLPFMGDNTWTAGNSFNQAMYYRIFFQVAMCNQFLAELTDDKINSRGFSAAQIAEAKNYRSEVRFLRALSYYHALDMYGGLVPFLTETSDFTKLPTQTNANDLFTFIEAELKAVEVDLKAPKGNEYGRVDKAAAWMLLSRLYLNAAVYVSSARYADASIYSKKVIDAGTYNLDSNFNHLFLTDNYNSNEIIFPINFDGVRTRSYGGTTFLTNAFIIGKMNPNDYGVGGGWNGMRTTPEFADKFSNPADERNNVFTDGQTKAINDFYDATNGYGLSKFKNVDKNGNPGSDKVFVDTDFPMFRLAEAYLNYAEANIIGGAGDGILALQYINNVRFRAHGNSNIANYSALSEVTPEELLDERGREMYHECVRRTDLRRFNSFTGSKYNWSWKYGVKEGKSLDAYREIFPIPSRELQLNTNLKQVNSNY